MPEHGGPGAKMPVCVFDASTHTMHPLDVDCKLRVRRNGKTAEAIAKLSSKPPSRRGAMSSSLKLSVVTTPRFRSSPSLAAFWRFAGSFAITSAKTAMVYKGILKKCPAMAAHAAAQAPFDLNNLRPKEA